LAHEMLTSVPPWRMPSGDYTLIHHPLMIADWKAMALSAAPLAAIGAIVGLVVWRVAYRRVGEASPRT